MRSEGRIRGHHVGRRKRTTAMASLHSIATHEKGGRRSFNHDAVVVVVVLLLEESSIGMASSNSLLPMMESNASPSPS